MVYIYIYIYVYMLTKLGYIDGKCYHIWHTYMDPVGSNIDGFYEKLADIAG